MTLNITNSDRIAHGFNHVNIFFIIHISKAK